MSKARIKKRKKSKSKGGRTPKVLRKIRIPKDQVMHIHRLANGGDPASAKRALQAFHNQLSARAIDELLRRITDPQGLGGIETGFDPVIGEYADIAITA
jgi:hypothetical protein